MELKHTKAGPQGMPQGPEQQEKDSGHMLEANAMGTHPLDGSTPPVQRKPSGADTLTASTGPNPGAKTAAGGGGTEGAEAAPSTQPGGQARAHSDKKMLLPGIKVPNMPQAVVNKLAGEEGIRQDVYIDTQGKLTVGLGHCLTKAECAQYKVGDVFCKAEIEAFAAQDLPQAWNSAEQQCAEIGVTDADFMEALFHVNFQLGTGWNTKFKKTWALMKAGQWEAAAVEVADSDWNAQTPVRVANFQAALRKLPASAEASTESTWSQYKREIAGKKQGSGASSGTMPKGKELIMAAQTKLHTMGLYPTEPDGDNGPKTKAAVKAFQANAGLKASGEVDAATWKALQGIGRSFLNGPAASEKSKEKTHGALPKDKSPKGVAAFAKGQAEMLHLSNSFDTGIEGSGSFVDEKYFVSQSPDATGSMRATSPGWANCRHAATDIVSRYLSAENPELASSLKMHLDTGLSVGKGFLRILEEDKSKREETKEVKNYKREEWLNLSPQAPKAIAYIDSKLKARIPVVVGIDHTYNRKLSLKSSSKEGLGYNEGTTDHFVTLTGIGKDENGRKFYTYFEVGTSDSKVKGTGKANRLVEVKPGYYSRMADAGAKQDQDYHISMVLIFEPDRAGLQTEINENADVCEVVSAANL